VRVATHDGGFHADDVFAVAALRRVDPSLEVVRTRDRPLLEAADVRVDVGLRDDPATGDFDHHQKGGAGARPNGIPYASFGLVWRHHGPAICGGDERVAAKVDARLVQGVDAIDTGFSLTTTIVEGVRPLDVSDLVDAFNPHWDEEPSDDDRLARFHEAVGLAGSILERGLAAATAATRATDLVEAAIARAEDPRVIELERSMPWHEAVVTGAPEALYVVYPKGADDWRVQAVPQALGTFANRRPLPEAWAGLQAEELAALTGVADAVFCHGARFLAVARSREGILELVRQALAAPA
jgi:uncharacterized UPF0160 family protein